MVSAATIYLKRFQGVQENSSFSLFQPRNSMENPLKVAEWSSSIPGSSGIPRTVGALCASVSLSLRWSLMSTSRELCAFPRGGQAESHE